MLTATAKWSNGKTITETFSLESERIVWIVELREWCKKNGFSYPEIITREDNMMS